MASRPSPSPRSSGSGHARSASTSGWSTTPCGAPSRGRASFLCGRGASKLLLGEPAGAVLAAEVETVLRERLPHLFDRLLAEVGNRRQLLLGLHHEIADRLDPDPLEAVVRADAELELLDREVLHPVRQRRLGRDAAVDRRGLAEALDAVEVGKDRQLADQ